MCVVVFPYVGHRPYVLLASEMDLYSVVPNDPSSFIRRYSADEVRTLFRKHLGPPYLSFKMCLYAVRECYAVKVCQCC